MKITKRQLKELLREQIKETLNETDWYDVEKETLPPLSKGVETAELDVDALRQVLQDALDIFHDDPDEPDSVYSVVGGVKRALEMLGASGSDPDAEWMDAEASARQQDWPPEPGEEEEGVVDLRGKTPDIGRLRRKLKYGFEDWRK
tara:strand:- start:39 stop:476 length:438 start_codon:yes stop_codon:yes gene_type:complete